MDKYCKNCIHMKKIIPSHKRGFCQVQIIGAMMKLEVLEYDYCDKFEPLREKKDSLEELKNE